MTPDEIRAELVRIWNKVVDERIERINYAMRGRVERVHHIEFDIGVYHFVVLMGRPTNVSGYGVFREAKGQTTIDLIYLSDGYQDATRAYPATLEKPKWEATDDRLPTILDEVRRALILDCIAEVG